MARDIAWRTLLDCGICSLPVDLGLIAHHYGIRIVLYSQHHDMDVDAISDDGFAIDVNGTKTVFLNDTVKTAGRRRFTLGHEFGHVLLKHSLDNIVRRNSEHDDTNIIEVQANIFSRDILMPACVLNAIDVLEPAQIAKVCNISMLSATIRAKRLAVLRERNAFGFSQLERMVLRQFSEYIEKNKH